MRQHQPTDNPAYHALEKLQRESSFQYTIMPRINKQKKNYFLVGLPATKQSLTLADNTYQSSGAPHISFYQPKGKSVCHFTWHGKSKNDTVHSSVILHVYFNQAGKYVDFRVSDYNTNEVIKIISPIEKTAILKHSRASTRDILDGIRVYIFNQYQQADKLVNEYLSGLEQISQHIETQLSKYKRIAELCIKAIQNKNRWTRQFDLRARFLEHLISHLERDAEKQEQPSFFPFKTPKKQNDKKKTRSQKGKQKREKNSTIRKKQSLPQKIREVLKGIDNEIDLNDQNEKTTDVSKALTKQTLLNKKLEALATVSHETAVELKIELWRQINIHHTALRNLFKFKARKGDLDAVKQLTPFIISKINPTFFVELLEIQNVTICEYFIQNFDECLFYMNHRPVEPRGKLDSKEGLISILHRVFLLPDNLPLFEMLLRNGVNPDSLGFTKENKVELLDLAIKGEMIEHVRVLLQYGVDPNRVVTAANITFSKTINKRTINQIIRKNVQEKFDRSFELDSISPLHRTIYKNNVPMVELLLQYGASVTKRNKDGHDAMGAAACNNKAPPNPDIIKLLIQYAADINSIQKERMGVTGTVLGFACQRNDFESVQLFIELGADPNQTMLNLTTKSVTKSGNIVADDIWRSKITPFLKAVAKGNDKIIKFLLTQKTTPLKFSTLAATYIYFFRPYVIGIKEDTFDTIFSKQVFSISMGSLLFAAISGRIGPHYDDDTINREVIRATQEGRQQSKAGNDKLAIQSFYVPLCFGAKEQRHEACYQLALCYQSNNQVARAIDFFQICIKHDLNSTIARNAEFRLRILNTEQLPTIKHLGSCTK